MSTQPPDGADPAPNPSPTPNTVVEGKGPLPRTVLLTGAPQDLPSTQPAPAVPAAGPERSAPPGYTIEGELGRGGMGVVYKARQVGLNRLVALKMILAGSHAGEGALTRFRLEAEAVARLAHPGIVQVYEIGEHDGLPFLSLEFCSGGNLADRLRGKPLPARSAAQLIFEVAQAVQAAHEAGIIHRDIKPGNILLAHGSRSSVLIDLPSGPAFGGVGSPDSDWLDVSPKIADFGLAKMRDPVTLAARKGGAHPLTRTGDVMGTPSYMAPEQASGDADAISPATDVYALGAVLYECLTGRPPFLAATHVDTVLRVLHHEPVPPRIHNHLIDADLERIVLKCLEKRPALRYPSAKELADDLRRYLRGEPVKARSVNLLERLQRELGHSQHEAHFKPWGSVLVFLGVLVFVGHLATSLMLALHVPQTVAFWVPRSLLLAVVLPLVLRYRPHHGLLPANSVERLLWAVWAGYFLAFGSLFWVMHVLGHDHLQIYGVAAALSGLAWFAMGGHVWGGCYLIGLGFFAWAPLLAWAAGSPWSPFYFGALWSAALCTLGGRYRWLGRSQ